jgi:transposase
MYRYQLAIGKADILRKRFIAGEYNSYALAKELKISTKTTWNYKREFERIRAEFPDKLDDFGFYPGEPRRLHWATLKYDELMRMLPVLVTELTTPKIQSSEVYNRYQALSQYTYKYPTFKPLLFKWIRESIIPVQEKLLDRIESADLPTLKTWRNGNNHRLWQISKCLDLAAQGATRRGIILQIESSHKTIAIWLKSYKEKGLKGFDLGPNPRNHQQTALLKGRKEKLVKLLHESPKLHGLNRTSWSMLALTAVYNQLYTPKLNYEQVRWCIHQMGYRYKKSREMLTSPDPKFREKIKKIQSTLQKLKPNEKFFSIDEYGPVSIKIKGGRTLKLENESPDWVPEKQKARGIVTCTAALELSTNQVTHFFSEKKNTFEMLKLIDLLIKQYANDETLYLCWDAVSWHNSNILKTYIEDHNKTGSPKISLAPLPASTQFLNVIESVFAGLAKAVIHNSDYTCTDECKSAISLHFQKRNADFQVNPKRAGRKIWGKEIVKARFSETHHTRNRNGMRGARPE